MGVLNFFKEIFAAVGMIPAPVRQELVKAIVILAQSKSDATSQLRKARLMTLAAASGRATEEVIARLLEDRAWR